MPQRRLFRTAAGVCLAAGMALAAEVPRQSPDFTINMLGGKKVLLSQYQGKVRALAFILTYCPHCQKTVGILSAMQKQYGARGFQVLASAIDSSAVLAVPDFIKRFQPPFPVGFNAQDPVMEYLHHPPMLRMMMPQVVFIDRQGVIRAQYGGDDDFIKYNPEQNIRAEIEALLKEGRAAHKRRHASAHRREPS